jgi:hypothetical protein
MYHEVAFPVFDNCTLDFVRENPYWETHTEFLRGKGIDS